MNDQAESLRNRLSQLQSKRDVKTIAIVSGKGGVGKTNFALNFSLSLCNQGKKVLLFDMDIGMGNIDILLGQGNQYTIVDLFSRGMSIKDIIQKGPKNLSYISGGTGLSSIFTLDYHKINFFLSQLQELLSGFDYIIFDMGAGITNESMRLLLSVDEIFVITTPEPTAITDAYSVIKFIYLEKQDLPLFIIVNRAQSKNEGNITLTRIKHVANQFLNKNVTMLGVLPDDRSVLKAVTQQVPFILQSPSSNISRSLELLTRNYLSVINKDFVSNQSSFISRLRRLLK